MGRKKLSPLPPQPAGHGQALLPAVKEALAALSEAGKEVTPSAIEGWIKVNQPEVWAGCNLPALKWAIETANREENNGRPANNTRGASTVGRKKSERDEVPPRVEQPEPAGAASKDNGPAPAGSPPREQGTRKKRASAAQAPVVTKRAAREEQPAPAKAAAPRPSSVPNYDPTRSELLRVLEIARRESSVSKLQKMVQVVKHLADEVGGLDRLAVCLDTLEEFGLK
jgi:hypothetical protein